MFIKICGNTNLDDALMATELGADALGFVFAPSKRQVTADQVAAITAALPQYVERVGVFTTTDAGEILSVATASGLTMVQLHSAFDPQLVDAIHAGSDAGSGAKLTVLQVMDVPAEIEPEALQETMRAALMHPHVAAVLLDASHGGASGGTGKLFAWQRVASTARAVQAETGGRVIIAGGLRPENVAAAIGTFAPWGVDVVSGVEAAPGKKDGEKLKSFFVNARVAQ